MGFEVAAVAADDRTFGLDCQKLRRNVRSTASAIVFGSTRYM
ncbi:MAG: hypothetical protein QQW96_08900 [Tychonema bourrellyi B0820]|nr:hypothetical protein [Tychonema bourrellyi]MDQ2097751.1 hypothetical protein [Tychonema bourrellyi B0820]